MKSIVLIGPPGSGKSTIGQILAEQLEWVWIDTDTEIEQKSGKSISDIFIDEGEPAFRELETIAVKAALAHAGAIVSLGGGSVLSEATQSLLRSDEDFVVYLKVGIASAAPRIGFNRDRPLLLVNPRQQWLSLLEKRRPIYEELADFIVETDEADPIDIASSIAAEWKKRNA